MFNHAPTRGAQVALGSIKIVGRMIWELNAKQVDLAQNTIVFKKAFSLCSTFKPEASLLRLIRGAVAEGSRKNSLGTCSRLLICPDFVTKEDKCGMGLSFVAFRKS